MPLPNLPPSMRRIRDRVDSRLYEIERRRVSTGGEGDATAAQPGLGWVDISSDQTTTPAANPSPLSFLATHNGWAINANDGANAYADWLDITAGNGVVNINQPGLYSVAGFWSARDVNEFGFRFTSRFFAEPGNNKAATPDGGITDTNGTMPTDHDQRGAIGYFGPLDRMDFLVNFDTAPTLVCRMLIQQLLVLPGAAF